MPAFLSVLLLLTIGFQEENVHTKNSPSLIEVNLRLRSPSTTLPGQFQLLNQTEQWNADETAIIICDMWDKHWCKSATDRVGEMATYMNQVIGLAREQGVFIIHAPSDVTDYYEDHPARKRAINAPASSQLPPEIKSWCTWIDEDESVVYPIDQSDGGCDCGDCDSYRAWKKQIGTIDIRPEDAISSSGEEIWNLMEARGIENVILLGVHTNMCVLGRPFGLRNMARYGKNVVLMRDLTDTMYNPERWPYVNHFTGTDLIVEHIEKYICSTITSTVFTHKPPFRFADDQRPRVVFIHAENEYVADHSLPEFAHEMQICYDIAADFAIGLPEKNHPDRHHISGLETLADADLAVVYVRRRALPPDQLKHIQQYLSKGKPLIALRTSNHAFAVRKDAPEGHAQWPGFDAEVLGGNYHGHHPNDAIPVSVSVEKGKAQHPILENVSVSDWKSTASLYKVRPLASGTQVLLWGTIEEAEPEPVLWTRMNQGSRTVYTSLGNWEDFQHPSFRLFLTQSFFWAMDQAMPQRNIQGLAHFEGKKN